MKILPAFTAVLAFITHAHAEVALGAIPADAFVDSIGVNIHTHYQGTVYDHPVNLKAALVKLGVRHVRDGMVDSKWSKYYERLNDLGRAGIKAMMITGIPVERVPVVADQLSDAIEAFEGPNEVDLNRWTPEDAAKYQKDLWKQVRSQARYDQIPVVVLSVTKFDYAAQMGSLGEFADFGNIHPYPGGWEPENRNAGMKTDLKTHLDGAAIITVTRPVYVTETGYTNHTGKASHVAVSREMSGIYIPRMLLHMFAAGVKRTYLYELFDLRNNPTDSEANFGLVANDGVTFKPAGIAVSNLVQILKDPGEPFNAGRLAFTVSNPKVQTALFQKRDGSFYIAFWLPTCLWDQHRAYGQKQQVDPADEAFDIVMAAPVKKASLFSGLDSTVNEQPMSGNQRFALTASERVAILRVVP